MTKLGVSSVLLWCVGGFALWLTAYRPHTPARGVAASFPRQVGEFVQTWEQEINDRQAYLLGTDDGIWRSYASAGGEPVHVVLVCHRENWKSVHPPDICLRGSNMVITGDVQHSDRGELVLYSRDKNMDYLSLYRYGAAEFATGSYSKFLLHHAPRALFRSSTDGYLIRVETWVAGGDLAAARQRCEQFLAAAEHSLARFTN